DFGFLVSGFCFRISGLTKPNRQLDRLLREYASCAAHLRGECCRFNDSATAAFVTRPPTRLIPSPNPASSAAALSKPLLAIRTAYGNVALQSAIVLVRPTAPGMFVTQ